MVSFDRTSSKEKRTLGSVAGPDAFVGESRPPPVDSDDGGRSGFAPREGEDADDEAEDRDGSI
jgi:hypothetical protein